MKILEICAAYKPAYIYGGPTMSVSILSEQLVKAGVEIHVFATTANGKEELPVTPGETTLVDGVEVTYFERVTKDHSHYSPALLKALRAQAKSFDIIHIHAWWNLVSLFSALTGLLKGVPVVVSPRGTLSPYSFQNKNIGPKWAIHHLLGKYLLKRSYIHATSEREADAVSRLVKPKKIILVPNFIKLPEKGFLTEKKTGDVFKLIFFSRIEEKKGLDLLIKALPTLNIPYHLTIAGDGNKNYISTLKFLATETGVAENITWAGFKQDDKFDVLQAHDLFVLPSYDENFGNAVIESLSVGTPVLISRQVGLADYVENNGLGFTCQTSPESISDAINSITANRQNDLDRIRRSAPGLISDDFNEVALVKKYIAMYAQITSK